MFFSEVDTHVFHNRFLWRFIWSQCLFNQVSFFFRVAAAVTANFQIFDELRPPQLAQNFRFFFRVAAAEIRAIRELCVNVSETHLEQIFLKLNFLLQFRLPQLKKNSAGIWS